MQQAVLTRAEEIAKGLYPHQIEGIAFLLGHRCCLFVVFISRKIDFLMHFFMVT